MVGKWHLGYPTLSHWPTHRGFDSFYGFLTSAVDDWNKTSLYSDGWLDLQDGVDLVTDAAELAEHAGLLFSRKVVFFISPPPPSVFVLLLLLYHEGLWHRRSLAHIRAPCNALPCIA